MRLALPKGKEGGSVDFLSCCWVGGLGFRV